MSVWPRKEQQPRKNTHPSHSTSRTTRLGCQALEQRWVLSSAPFLEGFVEQWIDTGETLTVDAMFADVLEGTVTGGGPGVGLDPLAYTSLGAFDPASNVVVDTSNPLQPKLSVGASDWFGVYENANAGADSYTIAVFTFTDFELDAGITLSATGDSPLAILSQGDISISGTIDVSAQFDGLAAQIAGAGGGNGGNVPLPLDGALAAGAPAGGSGVTGGVASGSGGGFGGAGGNGELSGSASGDGGIAYANLSAGIQGGSGGSAGGKTDSGGIVVLGGGGGGGIELGAVGAITVTSTGEVLADGGVGRPAFLGGFAGGGGAGGGILIHAHDVAQGGVLSANGGAGGSPGVQSGGGGGGGAIYIAYNSSGSFDNTGGTQTALGGIAAGVGAADGAAGPIDIVAQGSSEVPEFETYTYSINWGDGTTPDSGSATIDTPGTNVGDPVAGSFDGTHTYAEFGIYTVTVSVVSDTGADASETTDTQTFQVYVAGVGVKDGNLLAVGTDGDDVVKVYRSPFGGSYKVLSKLAGGDWDIQSLAGGSVSQIEMALGDGNDLAFVSRSVHLDATLDGGNGDDLLSSGSGDDVLLGGDDFDLLFGGAGRDLMIGGSDGDVLFGNSGEDILISGTTAFDQDAFDQESATLDSIMAEWTSSRSYNERVENLTGDALGVTFLDRDNGDNFLIAQGEDATVFDDESVDWLVGGRGRDLYFAGEDDVSLSNWLEVVEELEAEVPA